MLQLEKTPGVPGLVARLLRLAHTLKGASAVVKQRAIAERTHALEDALAPLRDREDALTKDKFEQILAHVDAISAQVVALEPPPTDGARQPQPSVIEEAPGALRADTAEMDALLETISEAGVQIRAMRRTIGIAEQARRLADHLVDRVAAQSARQAPQATAGPLASKTRSLPEELRDVLAKLEQTLKSGIDLVEREMQQARTGAERLRLPAVHGHPCFRPLERATP